MIKGTGLKPTPPSNLDFEYHKLFGAISLPEETFIIGEPRIKDQGSSDTCVAMATTGATEYQEDIELLPEYQFSKIKEIEGSIEGWGSDLRTGCKSAVKYGSLPTGKTDMTLENKGRDYIANWKNWDIALDDIALAYRKKSYFKISKSGYQDIFDAFRGALWQNKNYKRAIITGCTWEGEWGDAPDGIIPLEKGRDYYGHAFCFIGQSLINGQIYLTAQLSNGNIGDNGLFYFPREVVNRKFTYGGYMLIDIDPDEVKAEYWSYTQKLGAFMKLWRTYLLKML